MNRHRSFSGRECGKRSRSKIVNLGMRTFYMLQSVWATLRAASFPLHRGLFAPSLRGRPFPLCPRSISCFGSLLFGGDSLAAFKIRLVLAVQCPFRTANYISLLEVAMEASSGSPLYSRMLAERKKLGHLFRGDADCKSAPRLGSRNEGKLVPITASSCLLAGELGIWDRPPRRIWGRRLGKHRVGRADI